MFEIWREAQATGWCEEDRIEAFRNAQSEAMTLGFSPAAPIFEILFAQCLQKKGHAEGALAALEAAVVQIDSTGYNVWEPEVYRSMGDLLLRLNSSASAKAEVSYRRAIERARSQEAKSWELRAATSLARLWQNQGKRQDAYELLAPVYGWFTEGFDTEDLLEAKALLAKLASLATAQLESPGPARAAARRRSADGGSARRAVRRCRPPARHAGAPLRPGKFRADCGAPIGAGAPTGPSPIRTHGGTHQPSACLNHRRTPPAQRDVLRSCRFHRTLVAP